MRHRGLSRTLPRLPSSGQTRTPALSIQLRARRLPMRLLPLLGEYGLGLGGHRAPTCREPGREISWGSSVKCVWQGLQGKQTRVFTGCFPAWPLHSGPCSSRPKAFYLFILPGEIPKVLEDSDFDLSCDILQETWEI